ncbi:MAG TPA: hypothetical protein VJG66_00270 [Patescibacteria group bacterium]|nr:hypothetical protein [Patescibacteria group bacterium]
MSAGKEAFKSTVSNNPNISVKKDEFGSLTIYERLPSGLVLEAHPFSRRVGIQRERLVSVSARDFDPKAQADSIPWTRMIIRPAERERISVDVYFDPLVDPKTRRPDIDPKKVIKTVANGLEIYRAYLKALDGLSLKDYKGIVDDMYGGDSTDILILENYRALEREIARYKLLRDFKELAFST